MVVPMTRAWLLPAVTALGGLISGLIVFNLAPEAEGHGTDAAIEAIHKKGGAIRARIPVIKLVASAIAIGSGGSGGREGPAAQISAGFGFLMGKWLGLEVQNRRIAVAAGIGAGIGAIFRAPLGGALLSAEILYIHDLEVEALIPGLIASILGYSVFGAFFGYAPIFGAMPQIGFDRPIQLLYFTEAVPYLERDPDFGLALLEDSGKFAGIVTSQQLGKLAPGVAAATPLKKLALSNPAVLDPEDHMDVALEQMTAQGLSWAPVVQAGHLLGKLIVRDAIATYRNTLERSIRRTNALPGGTALFEAQLSASSPLVGKTLRSAHFPPNTLVVSILRRGETVFPHAETRLDLGDV
jgi:hypothetical protein